MPKTPPHISVIIPARNEEQYLSTCVSKIKAAATVAQARIEILVVLNRCTDATEQIAKELGCLCLHEDSENLSTIRNCGIGAAQSEIIVTIDADSYMSKNMLKKIVSVMEQDCYIGGGVMMFPSRISLGIFLTYCCLLPFVFRDRIAAGVFFFRKDDWRSIGGFDPSFYSAEDIDFAKRLRAYGVRNNKRFKMLFSSWIITSTRKFDRLGDWYFLKNLSEMRRLLKNQDREAANKIWYHFPRNPPASGADE